MRNKAALPIASFVAALVTLGGCPQNVIVGLQSGSAGGSSTGGSSTGGFSTGGFSTGGFPTGGSSTAGSFSTGGFDGGNSAASAGPGPSSSSSTGSSSSSGVTCATSCSQVTDCPVPSGPCLSPTCASGCCGTTGAAAGLTCGDDGGGMVCDGNGACVPTCSAVADCPAPGPCRAATCVNGICGTSTLVGMACTAPVSECCAGVCADITTDAQNCGTCKNGCGIGTCQSSTCVTPIMLYTEGPNTNDGGIAAIAIDATSVYWTSYGGPLPIGSDAGPSRVPTSVWAIMKVSKQGGTPVQLAGGQSTGGPPGIAVDATSVYWTFLDSVLKVPLDGGSPVTLASSQNTPGAIAVHGAMVYWLNEGTSPGYTDGTLMTAPTAGGTVTQVASGLRGAQDITASTQGVYWTNWTGGTVMQVAATGGIPTEIASGDGPFGIAIDAANVYWSDLYSRNLMSLPLAGGAAILLASDTEGPSSIAVDATSVYWATADALKKVPLGGGPTTVLANVGEGGLTLSQGVAVDDTGVYFIGRVNSISAIYKIPK